MGSIFAWCLCTKFSGNGILYDEYDNKIVSPPLLPGFFMILFIITCPWFAKNSVFLVIELASIAFGALTIIYMVKNSKFRARPDPAFEARLLTAVPYAYIRNPIYAAVILGFTALLVDSFS